MVRRVKTALVLPALLWLSSCEAVSGPSSGAEVALTAVPDPAAAERSSGVFYRVEGDGDDPDETREYDWKTSFTVTLSETQGSAVDISAIALRVQQATGGIITPPTTGDVEFYQYVPQASGNRLAGNGQATVRFDVWYDLPNLRSESVVTVIFTLIDRNEDEDEAGQEALNDFQFTEQVQVRVQ